MNKLSYAVIAATMALTATAASAAPILEFDGVSGTFSDAAVAGGDFTQTFNFDVATAGTIAATITSASVGAFNALDFTSVTLNGMEFVNFVSGPVDFRSIQNMMVEAGTQTLIVRGTSGGNGAYSGTLAFSAGAIPEPASWAMMIAGFGLVGSAMRRRQVKAVATYA